MNKTYVISYTEYTRCEVIWKSTSALRAIKEFWESFNLRDRKNVSGVRIFELLEIDIDTSAPLPAPDAREQKASK